MAESTSDSLFRIFHRLQDVFSSGVPSSCPPVVPELKKLNDMVYEVRSTLPEKQPTLEIIFFHGLQERHSNEAHFTTWLSHDNSQFWLQTWLVEAFPTARILTISYDASLKSTIEVGNLDMYCTAENLVSSLIDDDVRVGEAGCPVVLVGHCLGGLVLKQLCVSASNMLSRSNDIYNSLGAGRVNDLLSNMRGMFFYGTPHIGSLLGDEVPKSRSALAEEMKTFNALSMRRNEDFRQLTLLYKWVTCGIGEKYKTFLESLGKSILVVPEASARAYVDNFYSVQADHFHICKPSGKNASAFRRLADFLRQIEEAGAFRIMDISHVHRDYYIDLNGRAIQVTQMLAQPDVHTIFIKGLSGIGKSALARQVFYNIRRNFAVACFVSLDTIDVSSDCNLQMWQKIQYRVEEIDGRSISNHSTLLHYLKSKKVLMVVDNVHSDVQLKALETSTWLEGSRSKLIVTTTYARLGTTSNTSLAHFQVPYLSDEESHHLFSKYAFENGEVPRHVKPFIEGVIAQCANFPLSLKILGGYASTEDVHNPRLWLELRARMEKAVDVESGPDYRLWASLRVCFETLPMDDCQRDLFLDVATFFHDFPSSLVMCIWDACWEGRVMAWSNLKKRFLVSEDKDGKIQMHDQLRTLGQSIACERTATVDRRSRVFKTEDARELIANYQLGTARLPSIGLKLQNEQLERLFLAENTFVPYVQLRYLTLEGVEISGKNVKLPTSLVYLRWTNSPFKICPVDFSRLKKLIALDLTNCRAMKTLPTGLKKLKKLKWLELEGCVSLTDPFEMMSVCRLKYLGLSNASLSEICETHITDSWGLDHERVSSLSMLTSLDLSNTTVSALPEAIRSLQCLKTLNVRKTKLKSLPESIGELVELQTLDLNFTPLESLPKSIGKLRELRVCRFAQTKVTTLPDTIGDLSKLEKLILGGDVTEVPQTFSKLRCLKEYQGRLTLQDSLQHLASLGALQKLSLVLAELGEESPLAMTSGRSQAGIGSLLSPLSSLHALTNLYLHGRDCAQSLLPQLFCALQKIPRLQMLHFQDFRTVERIPHELGSLTNLKHLHIWGCGSLKELPESLGKLSKLTLLYLKDLPRLSRLPESLVDLASLSDLYIVECNSLQSMPSSCGHMSSVQGNETAAPNSSERSSPSQLQCLRSVFTTSWSLSECFLECHGGQRVLLHIKCEEMNKVMEKVSRNREGILHVLSTKAAVELFREMELSRREHDGLHEDSRHFAPHPSWRRGVANSFCVICCVDSSDEYCLVHRKWVCVRLTEVVSDSDSETEEDEADSEMGSWVHRFYTLLFRILASCSTVQS